MKKFCLLLAMLLAFPLAWADGEFTPVSTCGTVIDQPGHYRLVNDLSTTTIPDPGDFVACVIIASDEVTLDLNGYTISCDLDAPYFSFGVFSDYLNDGVNIMGGTVTDCVIGIEMSGNHSGTVKGMTMTENVLGMEIIAGSEVEIIKNKFLGNFETGIYATSFFSGDYVGPGLGHKFHKNLFVDQGFAGIETDGIEESVISCNRMEGNLVGLEMESPGFGNTIRKNVANSNGYGIFAVGLILGPDFVLPIAAGNTFMRNTALDNSEVDLAEAFLDFTNQMAYELPDSCQNMWKHNNYGYSIAVADCIPPSKAFNEENCAPTHDDFD